MSKTLIALLLMVVNCLYWGFSEAFFQQGSFVYGLAQGAVVSLLCAAVGGVMGRLIYKAMTHD